MKHIGIAVLGWVLPIILGPLVYVVARQLLNVSNKVDDLPPSVKRLAVVFFGTAISAALGLLGLTAPDTCLALISEAAASAKDCATALGAKIPVQGVVSAIVAMLIHEIKKSSPRS